MGNFCSNIKNEAIEIIGKNGVLRPTSATVSIRSTGPTRLTRSLSTTRFIEFIGPSSILENITQ